MKFELELLKFELGIFQNQGGGGGSTTTVVVESLPPKQSTKNSQFRFQKFKFRFEFLY